MLEAQKEVLDAKNNEFRTAFDDACGLKKVSLYLLLVIKYPEEIPVDIPLYIPM